MRAKAVFAAVVLAAALFASCNRPVRPAARRRRGRCAGRADLQRDDRADRLRELRRRAIGLARRRRSR